DLRQYDALLEGADGEQSESGTSLSDNGMSLTPEGEEQSHEPGCLGSVGSLPAGTASAGGASAVRGGGAAGDGRGMELSGLPAGVAGAGMPAAASEPHRASAARVQTAPGEELVGAGREAPARQGGAAVTRPAERGVRGAAGERAGVRSAGLREDACPVRCRSGVGAFGSQGAVHDLQPAGAGTAGGETGPDAEGAAEASESVAGAADRR